MECVSLSLDSGALGGWDSHSVLFVAFSSLTPRESGLCLSCFFWSLGVSFAKKGALGSPRFDCCERCWLSGFLRGAGAGLEMTTGTI